MSKWRPTGWENLYRRGYNVEPNRTDLNTREKAFEDGADAMLEALRTGKTKVINQGDHPQGVGVLVFISDDPKETRCFADTLNMWTAITRWRMHYQQMWQTHPATKVIETGWFCPKCGKQISPTGATLHCSYSSQRGREDWGIGIK